MSAGDAQTIDHDPVGVRQKCVKIVLIEGKSALGRTPSKRRDLLRRRRSLDAPGTLDQYAPRHVNESLPFEFAASIVNLTSVFRVAAC